MNVADLTDAQIMQLPDFCFGERYVCATYFETAAAGYHADISPIVLPDKCVLWEIDIWMGQISHMLTYIRLSLAYLLPANEAAFILEPALIEDLGNDAVPVRGIYLSTTEHDWSMSMKQLLETGGRRLLTMINLPTDAQCTVSISAVFSAIPTRVPDWMVSI